MTYSEGVSFAELRQTLGLTADIRNSIRPDERASMTISTRSSSSGPYRMPSELVCND